MGRLNQFDLVHDNQCLGTGIWKIHDAGLPVLETIHHPITVDRRLRQTRSNALETFHQKSVLCIYWYVDQGRASFQESSPFHPIVMTT